jgi:hypothetical protein
LPEADFFPIENQYLLLKCCFYKQAPQKVLIELSPGVILYNFLKIKNYHYISVDNHPKLTEIGKNVKISGFWATKATVKHFFSFFCD